MQACGVTYCPAERRRANLNDELPGGGGVSAPGKRTMLNQITTDITGFVAGETDR